MLSQVPSKGLGGVPGGAAHYTPCPVTIRLVAFGEIAKQLAQQALTESITSKPPAPAQPDSLAGIIVGQIHAMQRACKEDEELVVLCRSGSENIRVLEVIVPAWPVMVFSGLDEAENTARVIAAAENVQLVCKVMKAKPSQKPIRVNFHLPKAK